VSEDIFEEAQRDAKRLAGRIRAEDYEKLKRFWENKSYMQITFLLRNYGLEFKGITYLETLMEELEKQQKGIK